MQISYDNSGTIYLFARFNGLGHIQLKTRKIVNVQLWGFNLFSTYFEYILLLFSMVK